MNKYYETDEWRKIRNIVLERDNNECKYCKKPAYTADHITPRGWGGPDTLENLVAVCRFCNMWFGGTYYKTFEEKQQTYYKNFIEPREVYKKLLKEFKVRFKRKPSMKERCRIRRYLVNQGYELFLRSRLAMKKPYCLKCYKVTKVDTNSLCLGCR